MPTSTRIRTFKCIHKHIHKYDAYLVQDEINRLVAEEVSLCIDAAPVKHLHSVCKVALYVCMYIYT